MQRPEAALFDVNRNDDDVIADFSDLDDYDD